VDIWGFGFQPGAKIIAQGNNWSSDQAAVTFITGTHLQAVIDAQSPARFAISVQNPDAQTSITRQFVVTQPASTPDVMPLTSSDSTPSAVPSAPAAPPETVVMPTPQPKPVTVITPAADPSAPPAPSVPAAATPPSSVAQPDLPAGSKVSPVTSSIGSAAASPSVGFAATAPVLDEVTPTSHATGRFSVDLHGSGFQRGAKLIAQGNNWRSDQAAVVYLDSSRLRATIDAQNPAQFTIAVQNPDLQISAQRPLTVTKAGLPLTGGNTPSKGPAIAQASSAPPLQQLSPKNPALGAAMPGNAPLPSNANTGKAPILKQVTPDVHQAGRFSVDLYGSGFQPGAKLIAQGNGWKSDQAAVMYLGPDHLQAVIDAQNPAQFTVAVQNPDMLVSAAHPFQVVPALVTPAAGKSAKAPDRVSSGDVKINSTQNTQLPRTVAPPTSPSGSSTTNVQTASPINRIQIPSANPPTSANPPPGRFSPNNNNPSNFTSGPLPTTPVQRIMVPPGNNPGSPQAARPVRQFSPAQPPAKVQGVKIVPAPVTNTQNQPVNAGNRQKGDSVYTAPGQKPVLVSPTTPNRSNYPQVPPAQPVPAQMPPRQIPAATPTSQTRQLPPVHTPPPAPGPPVRVNPPPPPPQPKPAPAQPPPPANNNAPKGPNDKKKP